MIGIIGEFNPASETHKATDQSIMHSCRQLSVTVETEWISTKQAELELEAVASRCDGFWIAPGSPYHSMRGALRVIEYARKHRRPLLGTCGGYQHIVIEFARNQLQMEDAGHAEYDPNTSRLVVGKLACSLVGQKLDILLNDEDSTVYQAYGEKSITEGYYCSFGLNPAYRDMLQINGLKTVGTDREGESRIVELTDHPFFIGTLFVPQAQSTEQNPHPIVSSFIRQFTGITDN